MGWMFVTGTCFICNRAFVFNPNKVPSVSNRPICRECITSINEIRKSRGIDEVTIYSDSYAPEEV